MKLVYSTSPAKCTGWEVVDFSVACVFECGPSSLSPLDVRTNKNRQGLWTFCLLYLQAAAVLRHNVEILGIVTKKPTLKQINKTLLGIKVRMLKIDKSELKINETLIIQVTNASFYKVDQNRLQLVVWISVHMQKLIH